MVSREMVSLRYADETVRLHSYINFSHWTERTAVSASVDSYKVVLPLLVSSFSSMPYNTVCNIGIDDWSKQ